MEAPIVTRSEYTLVGIDDGYLNLMDDSGEVREDIKFPEDGLGGELQRAYEAGTEFQVAVLTATGTTAVVSFRETAK